MTGEITLRGKVMPVGGIKEKVLAAKRATGIDSVIMPKQNEKDLEDIPAGLREEMTFTFVDTIDEVFAAALEPLDEAAPKHTPLVAAGAARKAART